MALYDGDKFLIHRKRRRSVVAGLGDVLAPGAEMFTPLRDGHRFVISDIIDLAAKGIEAGHRVALFARQEDESEREI
jgi:hypothetical protein